MTPRNKSVMGSTNLPPSYASRPLLTLPIFRKLIPYCCFAFSLGLAVAEPTIKVPEAVVSYRPEVPQLRLDGLEPGTSGNLTVAEVDHPAFARANVVQVWQAMEKPFWFQLRADIPFDVEQGDVLVCEFYARTSPDSESSEGTFTVVVEQVDLPNVKSLVHLQSVGPEWQHIVLPFAMKESYSSDTCKLNFQLGALPQTIELGNIALHYYAQTRNLEELPSTIGTTP